MQDKFALQGQQEFMSIQFLSGIISLHCESRLQIEGFLDVEAGTISMILFYTW